MLVSNQEIRISNEKIIGNGNTVIGNGNKVIGNNNKIYGNNNKSIGNNNAIFGDCSKCVGNNNRLDGKSNSSVGNNNSLNVTSSNNDNKIKDMIHKQKKMNVFSSGKNSTQNFYSAGKLLNKFVNGVQTIKDGKNVTNSFTNTSNFTNTGTFIVGDDDDDDEIINSGNFTDTYNFVNENNIKNNKIIEKLDDKIEIPKEEEEEQIKEEDNVNEELICSICSIRKIKTVILDCKHSKLCITCSRAIMLKDGKVNDKIECPICRQNISKGIIKIFN